MLRDPYDEIRQRVSCLDAARRYGLAVNRSGFVCCPFHRERTASMKLYPNDGGFYCFGCHEGGDVVKLAAGILGASRVQAAQQINKDFSLGLSFGRDRETPDQRRERQERTAAQEWLNALMEQMEDAQIKLCAVHRLGWEYRYIPPEELTGEQAEAVKVLPVAEYYLNILAGPQKKNLEAGERIQAEIGQLRDFEQIQEGVKTLCRLALRLSQPQCKTA